MFMAATEIMGLNRSCEAILHCHSARDIQATATEVAISQIGGSVAMCMLDRHHFPACDLNLSAPALDRDRILLQIEQRQRSLFDLRGYHSALQDVPPTERPSIVVKDEDDGEFYQRYLAPFGFQQEMSISLRNDADDLGLLSIARERGASPFDDAARAKAAILGSAVRSALQDVLASERLVEADRNIDALSVAMSYEGVLILDHDLETSYRNARGVELLRRLAATDRRPGTASSNRLPDSLARLCRTFARDQSTPTAYRATLTTADEGSSIEVSLRRLEEAGGATRYLVGLSLEDRTLPPIDVLRRNGLTRRQIDIVAGLSLGLANRQIADKLNISAFTVQSHIKSIYEKLGVHNRIGMMVAINQMSP